MINIQLSQHGFKGYLDASIESSIVRSLNTAAFRTLGNLRDKAKETFIIRRPWVLKGFRYDKATKRNPVVNIFHRDPYLVKQVEGGNVTPDNGHDKIPVPVGIRENVKQVIPRKKRRNHILESKGVFEASNAIWKRTKGKKPVILYSLKDQTNHSPMFNFEDCVETSMKNHFARHLRQEILIKK